MLAAFCSRAGFAHFEIVKLASTGIVV